jgi:hypothetical protein
MTATPHCPAPAPSYHADRRPAPRQPGTLRQQLDAIGYYLTEHARFVDPAGAWQTARLLCIPHAAGRASA